MEDNSAQIIPISIQPKNVFGLRTDVIGNIHFTAKQEVIYPVEGVLAFHDYVTNKQKFLRFPEKVSPAIISLSPNRRQLAIAEIYEENAYSVNIYDMSTLKKLRSLQLPSGLETPAIHCMSFTHDSKGLVVLTKSPEETLVLFMFDKAETVIQGRAANTNLRGTAQCISCNTGDPGLVAVGGDNVFKLMSRSEKGFGLSGNIKCDGVCITSLAWVSMEMLVAGTSKGLLLFVENGYLKMRYDAFETDVMDLSMIVDPEEGTEPTDTTLFQIPTNGNDKKDRRIVCLSSFPKGFAYAIFNTVYVFERESKFRFERKTLIKIVVGMYPEKLYQIMNIAINSQQDTVIATTMHSQIYIGILFVPESLKAQILEFKMLGEPLHIDEIIDLSVCAWKPIIMTASKDQTIRIWNYETEKTELVKKYQVTVTVIELHPSGLLAAIGFSDHLRMMEIFLDDLEVIKTYNFPHCQDAVFSNYGHLMAAAYENTVTIISVFNFETVKSLKGHNGAVLGVAWSKNDKYIVSVGIEGAVYQWDIETGSRIHEVVQKGTEYRAVALSSDMSSTYVVTNHGFLRDVANSEIVREVKPPVISPLLAVTLSRSDLVMFISSEQGHLYNVQLPFLEAGGGICTNYRFFHSAVTRMKISYDDTLLITVSKQGTLAVWVILNNSGKIASLDQDLGKCTEVLIPRKYLTENIDTISSLEKRMQQQIKEFQYQLKQGEVVHDEQLKEVHKGYSEAIDQLKSKNEIMELAHIEELNVITSNIADAKEEHQREIQKMETNFHEKIIIEYQNSADIKQKMDEMRGDYENKLHDSAKCLQETVEALEKDFKKQLEERQDVISQLMQEMEDKKSEFEEYCRQVDLDNDRTMVSTKVKYEKKLKEEQELTLQWRGDAGILKKKYLSMSKDVDELRVEIETLKEEHIKYQKTIAQHIQDMEDLRKEIEERDSTISDKEKRIKDIHRKNQELERYKQTLNHKITELKAQIEPRERQIREKRNQVAEMERELEALHQTNVHLELQLSELRDKIHGTNMELKSEKNRARAARAHSMKMCAEIYRIGKIQKPDELKDGIKILYQKYSDDSELQKSFALDAEVQNEFVRQRDHIEKLATVCKSKDDTKREALMIKKLINDNSILLDEINTLRKRYQDAQGQVANMETILGFGSKTLSASAAKKKLQKVCEDYDERERKHSSEIEMLQKTIKLLTEENHVLKSSHAAAR